MVWIVTFMFPALRPNFSVRIPNESIIPIGTGAGRPMSAKASLIRVQSNLRMLCPAHTLPFKMLNIRSATSSKVGAAATTWRVIPSHRPDLIATADRSPGCISVQ